MPDDQRHRAGVLQGARPGLIASTPIDDLQDVPALARRPRPDRRCCRRRSSTRTSRSTASTLTGAQEQRPRWKRCVDATDSDLGEALGQALRRARRSAPKARRARCEMVQAIESGARHATSTRPRLDDRRHQEAGARSSCAPSPTRSAIPDQWRDYSALRDRARRRARQLAARQRVRVPARQLAKIGKPVDRPSGA